MSRSGSAEPIIDNREVQLIPMEVEELEHRHHGGRGSKVWAMDQVDGGYDRSTYFTHLLSLSTMHLISCNVAQSADF